MGGHADESRSGTHNSHLTHKSQAEMDVIPRGVSPSIPLDNNLFSKRSETDEPTAAGPLATNLGSRHATREERQTLGVSLKSAVGLSTSFCAVLSLY